MGSTQQAARVRRLTARSLRYRSGRSPSSAAQQNVMWREDIRRSLPWRSGAITVRDATEDCAEIIQSLDSDSEVKRYLGGPQNRSIEETQQRLRANPGYLYVIDEADDPIGYCGYVENTNTKALDVLIVLAARHRGRGLGLEVLQILVEKVACFAPDLPLAISTQKENIRAQGLLRKFGLNQTGEYADDFGFSYVVFTK
ncbi:MAG: GNAT family N-acetyltransferase [Gammaproteobacteria bacterium]|nr:GNAT family N-acetyltransferase [Gammaproteobacteria bacterium]